ncbi:LLM class flavin-dependent oxidoreductase [Pseudonocardia pini]|uniref:LLM class flavin-dependent oxidoreductase n=1 Tax=Pseudonocardia pini TaxID=2758030 RepID=UPI0028B0815E|nr:LLM class flavin-dependent oxidoreductase [Pseudonocardia pini]
MDDEVTGAVSLSAIATLVSRAGRRVASPPPQAPVEVGICLDLRNPSAWRRAGARLYGFALELCEEAERVGLHSAWFSEHHLFADGYLPQPLTFAAAVAARTRRLRLGTSVLLAPLRPAVQIAEEAAVVDLLSGGRLELGIGAGYREPEFALYGADPSTRRGVTAERVRELRRIWLDGAVTPSPAQPRVPIWLGFTGPRGARLAGRLGEGLLSADPALAEPYRDGLAEAGLPPETARMAGPLTFFVADDPERAWASLLPHHTTQWDGYRQAAVEGTDLPTPPPLDGPASRSPRLMGGRDRILVATPQTVAAQIRDRVAGTPIRTVYTFAAPAGLSEDLAVAHVRALGTLSRLLAAAPTVEAAAGG